MEQIIISYWLELLYSHSGFILLFFFLNYCPIALIIIGRRYNFPVYFDIKFFILLPWQIFCYWGVWVFDNTLLQVIVNSLTQYCIISSKVFLFVVHCEAMLFLSMILTFWIKTLKKKIKISTQEDNLSS